MEAFFCICRFGREAHKMLIFHEKPLIARLNLKVSICYCNFVRTETILITEAMRLANLNKESITKAVLKDVKKQYKGAEIHARHTRDLPNPAKFAWKNNEANYMPDIIVRNNGESLNIYEIELTDEFDVNKWRLYSLYAKKSRGRFHLVMPRWLLNRAKDKIQESNLKNIQLEFVSES